MALNDQPVRAELFRRLDVSELRPRLLVGPARAQARHITLRERLVDLRLDRAHGMGPLGPCAGVYFLASPPAPASMLSVPKLSSYSFTAPLSSRLRRFAAYGLTTMRL